MDASLPVIDDLHHVPWSWSLRPMVRAAAWFVVRGTSSSQIAILPLLTFGIKSLLPGSEGSGSPAVAWQQGVAE
jgi:hypothetical protein